MNELKVEIFFNFVHFSWNLFAYITYFTSRSLAFTIFHVTNNWSLIYQENRSQNAGIKSWIQNLIDEQVARGQVNTHDHDDVRAQVAPVKVLHASPIAICTFYK